jgi:Zn-dependent protease with chaperone function
MLQVENPMLADRARSAQVRALRRIQGHATFDVPSRMEAFFIENPVSNRLTGLLATHPSMDERIEALQRYAGALDAGAATQSPRQSP